MWLAQCYDQGREIEEYSLKVEWEQLFPADFDEDERRIKMDCIGWVGRGLKS